MKDKTDRRKFIRNISLGGLSAGLLPGTMLDATKKENNKDKDDPAKNQFIPKRQYNGPYSGEYLKRVAFPIGGLGAGMFCLEGSGAISHVSVRNRPEIFNEPGWFAAICIKGQKNKAKILEGPVPDWKKFGLSGSGNGLGGATTGLPHFQKAVFNTKFPFATIDLTDPELPLTVQLTGWSPFIPTEDDNSSLPVGAIEYKFINKSAAVADLIFSFNAKNFLQIEKGTNSINVLSNGLYCMSRARKKKHYPVHLPFLLTRKKPLSIIVGFAEAGGIP
jgi:hypothetical protein